MFWCHNCQKHIQSLQQLTCELCHCEAIEQISQQNNPQNFQPYVPQQNNQPSNQTNRSSEQVDPRIRQSMRDPLGLDLFRRMPEMSMLQTFITTINDQSGPVIIRYTVSTPVFGILLIDNEEDQKTPVEPEKLSQLQKVQILQEECAICQQKEGSGIKLPCKHDFHEHCIKPWFEQTNTCPCCRTAL